MEETMKRLPTILIILFLCFVAHVSTAEAQDVFFCHEGGFADREIAFEGVEGLDLRVLDSSGVPMTEELDGNYTFPVHIGGNGSGCDVYMNTSGGDNWFGCPTGQTGCIAINLFDPDHPEFPASGPVTIQFGNDGPGVWTTNYEFTYATGGGVGCWEIDDTFECPNTSTSNNTQGDWYVYLQSTTVQGGLAEGLHFAHASDWGSTTIPSNFMDVHFVDSGGKSLPWVMPYEAQAVCDADPSLLGGGTGCPLFDGRNGQFITLQTNPQPSNDPEYQFSGLTDIVRPSEGSTPRMNHWNTPGLTLKFPASTQLVIEKELDTDNDVTFTEAALGQGWGGITFESGSTGTLTDSRIEFVHNPYSGFFIPPWASLTVNNADVTLEGTIVADGVGVSVDGILVTGSNAVATLTTDGSVRGEVRNHDGNGIVVQSGADAHVYDSLVETNGIDGVRIIGNGSKAYLWTAEVLDNGGVGLSSHTSGRIYLDKPGYGDPLATTTVDQNDGGGLYASAGGYVYAGTHKTVPDMCRFYHNNRITRHDINGSAPYDVKSITGAFAYAQCNYWSDDINDPYNDVGLLGLVDDGSSTLLVTPMLTQEPSLNGEPPIVDARFGGDQGEQLRVTVRSMIVDAHEALVEDDAQTAFSLLRQALQAADTADQRRMVFSAAMFFLQEAQPPAVMMALEPTASGSSSARPWALRALLSAYEAQGRLADARQAAALLSSSYPASEHAVAGLAAEVEFALRMEDEAGATAALTTLTVVAPEDMQTEVAQRLYFLTTGMIPPDARSSSAATAQSSLEADTEAFRLLPSYPNPFNPETQIAFEVNETMAVRLDVFDALGREVATLANGSYEPGHYASTFGGPDLASGLYIVRVTATPETSGMARTYTEHITLLK